MNPVFYLIVIIAVVVLWFLLAIVFYPIGKLVYRIFLDTMHELNRDDENFTRKDDEK